MLSPLRKGLGQPPGSTGEGAVGQVRLDTGAIGKGSDGTRLWGWIGQLVVATASAAWISLQAVDKSTWKNGDVGTKCLDSERVHMAKLRGTRPIQLHMEQVDMLRINGEQEHRAFSL